MSRIKWGVIFLILALSAPVRAQTARAVSTLEVIEEPAPVRKLFRHNRPDFAPETRKDLVSAFETGFSRKAGGDLFTAKFGRDKFRYEYGDEWIVFEPLNHLSLSLVSSANELYYANYWPDTNLRFTIKDYGVKVDIILMSDAAPKEFSFRVSKSRGWKDEWIRAPFAYRTTDMLPVGVTAVTKGGVLTYTLNEKILAGFEYPLILDPTFTVAAGVDDTYSQISDTQDVNQWNQNFVYVGTIPANGDWQPYFRWALDIPRASKVSTSTIQVKNQTARTSTFATVLYKLNTDNKWENSNGFNTTNYPLGSDLAAIVEDGSGITWNVTGTWSAETWYTSPEIATLIQKRLDDYDYDPSHSQDKYIAIHWSIDVQEVDWEIRNVNSYEDDSGVDTAKLNVTYDPWGSVRVGNGYKYDADCDCMRYFDY